MDPLRVQPIALQSAQFSYRSLRSNPNVVRLLGAPAFLHYILMRRAKLQPLLVSASMVSICADGANASCAHPTNACTPQSPPAAVQGANQSPPPTLTTMRDLPELELNWPHKIPEKEVAVYIQELQQASDPNFTGTVLDLLF